MKKQTSKNFLAVVVFFSLFCFAKSSEAVYPMAGRKKILTFQFIFGIFILFAGLSLTSPVYGATLYMPDNCANLQACFSVMQGGDTLIIRDGTYTGAENTITYTNYPPSGNAEAYTTIKAENAGKVLFDGEDARNVFSLTGSSYTNPRHHIQFEGLEWGNNNFVGAGGLVAVVFAEYIKFLKCGAFDAHDGDDGHVFNTYNSKYILFEDCYAYGAGDYNFMAARDSEKIVFRRCVARHDRHIGWDQAYGFVAYGSKEVEFQNCIFIDSDQQEYYIGSADNLIQPYAWMFRYADQGFGLNNVNFRGSISLGNTGGGIVGSNIHPADTSVLFENCIHWDGTKGSRTRSDGADLHHVTFGDITGTSTWNQGIYLEANTNKITDSIVANVYDDTGILNGIGNDYNSLYGNQRNYIGVSPGAHDYSSENGNEINPLMNSLRYLPRIETGSDLEGAASDGGDIGATITKRIGVSGTLWGEEGYNTVTEENLWPFPNEDLIKEKMAQYSYDDPNDSLEPIQGARGFAASGNGLYGGPITLTSYIWEYLENPCPEDVCSYGDPGDTTAPGAPSGLAVN